MTPVLFKLWKLAKNSSATGAGFGTFVAINTIQGYIFPEYDYSYFLSPEMIKKVSQTNENNKAWNNYANKSLANLSEEKSEDLFTPEEIYERIRDASLKISLPCDSGTAWILDYEEIDEEGKYLDYVPTEEETKEEEKLLETQKKGTQIKEKKHSKNKNQDKYYPTKWFIATNAHVVGNYIFDSNPYEQSLPIVEGSRFSSDVVNMPWNSSCKQMTINRTKDMQLQRDGSDVKKNDRDSKLFYWTEIVKPKLIYSAIDYLGDRYNEKGERLEYDGYYKDFVVIEVEFNRPWTAKIMTNNFYNKYPSPSRIWNKEGRELKKSEKFLNVFADEVMKKYTVADMSKQEYFIGGYPATDNKSESSGIFRKNESENKKYSKLSYWRLGGKEERFNIKNKYGENIIGHVSVDTMDRNNLNITTYWNNRNLYNWGYNYLLDDIYELRAGASGSIVANRAGDILGVYRMHDKVFNQGFADPLRSEGIYVNNQIITPGYDLIRGSVLQKTSYKQQLEKYHPNIKTYLKLRDWK